MISTIILDFGGVLTGLDKERCMCALRQIGAGRIAYYVDECRQEDLFHEIEVGNWGVKQFCDEARRRSSGADGDGTEYLCAATDEEIVWAWNELITGIPVEKLRFIKSLRDTGKYKIVLLSNTNIIHWEKAVRDFFTVDGMAVDDYFDEVFLSFEMHVVKPDAAIYQQMLERLGVKAEECVFVDDSLRNCQGAESVGIKCIHAPNGEGWMERFEEFEGCRNY